MDNQPNSSANYNDPSTEQTKEEEKILEKGDFGRFPNELIENIFDYLAPNDLAAISLTCNALKKLAETYVVRKQQYGCISIELDDGGKIKRWGNYENYELRFRSLIDNVHLKINTIESSSIRKLFEFIKINLTKNIRRLGIDFGIQVFVLHPQPNIINYEIIADQLENVGTLILRSPPSLEGVLKYCKSLHTLYIAKDGRDADNDKWKNIVQPKLKSFTFADVFRNNPIDLTTFLSNAPQLQSISLNNLPAIRSLLNSDCTVAHADLWFYDSTEFLSHMNDIQKNCAQNRIKDLHLIVNAILSENDLLEIFNRIQNLENVKSLRCALINNISNVDILKNMTSQPHLKTFCVKISQCNQRQFVIQLAKLLPALQELHIYNDLHGLNTTFTPKQFLMSIVGELAQIKRFYFALNVSFQPVHILNDDIVEMNSVRAKLASPSFLTIHTKNVNLIDTTLENISISNNYKPNCLFCSLFTLNKIFTDWDRTITFENVDEYSNSIIIYAN